MQISTVDKFDTIDYLATGTDRQQFAYRALSAVGIFEQLQIFHPLLLGTIPLDIAIDSSDLDIICEAEDLEFFQKEVETLFSTMGMFRSSATVINHQPTILANFNIMGFEIELFGQNVPIKEQNGYRHMIKEYEILTNRGQDFREKIIALKTAGVKTEPAFAQLLNIKGDPYTGLLAYKDI